HAILMIQDNGIGIPESIDIATSAKFGMQLVGMLTRQLEGTIRIERENGARFILEFDI
ncbi:MAG: histidine kinase, partial [Syntrophus sp. (in: bacteria)]|nr:histidine kinase [Syntrophus sp. (in: bacteria)]